MKYIVKHCKEGYQVCEKDGASEILIASFHKSPKTRTGEKSQAQIRAEEYCRGVLRLSQSERYR
jgi:hypothetical protein